MSIVKFPPVNRVRPIWVVVAYLLVASFFAHLAWGYDADELQNLHFAWNIGQGHVPYLSFFEHHPPLLHYALAAIVRHQTVPGLGLLIGTRLVALAIAVLIAGLFYTLLRLVVSPAAASWGVLALISLHTFATSGLELRADCLALACVLAALLSILAGVRGTAAKAAVSGVIAGLLCGHAACLTQKAALLSLGLTAWAIGVVALAPDRDTRRGRAWVVAGFLLGGVVPVALLVGSMCLVGAGPEFIDKTLVMDLRWASECTWTYVWQQAVLPSFVLFVLAASGALRVALNARSHLRDATPHSSVVALLITGTLCMLRTPVPHAQSFLFLVAPWSVFVAIQCVEYYLASPPEFVRDWRFHLGAVLVCLYGLSTVNRVVVLLGWALIVGIAMRCRLLRAETHARAGRVYALVISVALLVLQLRIVGDLWHHEGSDQRAFVGFACRNMAPTEPVLGTWPLISPFHAQPVYWGFARRGSVQTIGAVRMATEYIAAFREGRTRVAIVDDLDVERQLPQFSRFLRSECRRLDGAPKTRDRLQIYVFERGAARPVFASRRISRRPVVQQAIP